MSAATAPARFPRGASSLCEATLSTNTFPRFALSVPFHSPRVDHSNVPVPQDGLAAHSALTPHAWPPYGRRHYWRKRLPLTMCAHATQGILCMWSCATASHWHPTVDVHKLPSVHLTGSMERKETTANARVMMTGVC